jgi:hypothetical protein
MKYSLLIAILFTGCLTRYSIPSKRYNDTILSTAHNADLSTTYRFKRHDWEYEDIVKRHKLLERRVYDSGQLVYRYPVLRGNVRPSDFFLKSGRVFLTGNGVDTLVFINEDLPTMNRFIWASGVTLMKITENTYWVKPLANNKDFAKFYVSVGHNMEEVKNDKGFIADSLVLPIR